MVIKASLGLLIIALMLTTCEVQCQMTIQRLNYGIIFQRKGRLSFTPDNWLHTFQIKLPQLTNVPPMPTCNEINTTCTIMTNVLRHMSTIRDEILTRTNDTIVYIKNIIPQTNNTQSERQTRSVLPFIGDLSTTLFGTATFHDVQVLAQHIQLLAKRVGKTNLALQRNGKHVSSFIQTTTNRLDNAFKAINDNHLMVTKLYSNLKKSISDLTSVTSFVTSVLTDQITISTDYFSSLEELRHSIIRLIENQLSPHLIPPHTLVNTLTDIEGMLKSTHHSFRIATTDYKYYYSQPNFLFARDSNNIYITIKIPLTHVDSPFDLYDVISLPVPVDNSTTHATQLLELPDLLGVTRNRNYFIELSQQLFQSCSKFGNEHFCSFQPTLRSAIHPSCLFSIFRNDKILTPNLCNF